jgi:dihydroflavonol-4-reductase
MSGEEQEATAAAATAATTAAATATAAAGGAGSGEELGGGGESGGGESGATQRKGVRLPRWSAEEEANLRRLVAAEGSNNWASKAQRLGTTWTRTANAVQQYYLTMVKKDEQEAATGSRVIARNSTGAGVKRRRENEGDAPAGVDIAEGALAGGAGRPSADDYRTFLSKMGRSTTGTNRELTLRTQEVQRWLQADRQARSQGAPSPDGQQPPLVVVTGAGGYLAGHIISQLLKKNYRVRGTVRTLEVLRDEEAARCLEEIRTMFPTVELYPCDLLGGAANFRAAFEGVTYVVHTACPNQTRAADPERELFRPAVDGVQAVMTAARAAGVARVVLTSSCGAVQSNRVPKPSDHEWSEMDWNDDSSLRIAPYRYAKAYAERMAWKCAEGDGESGNGSGDGSGDQKAAEEDAAVEMVSICPAMILGPPIYRARKKQGLSVRYLAAILQGNFRSGVPGGPCFGVADVRDVAAAHVQAIENVTFDGSGDRKRYVLSSASGVTAMEMVDCLNASDTFIEKHSWVCGCMPDNPIAATSYRPRYNVAKATTELQATCRPWKETVVDMANAMIELGIVQPPPSVRLSKAGASGAAGGLAGGADAGVLPEVWGSRTSPTQSPAAAGTAAAAASSTVASASASMMQGQAAATSAGGEDHDDFDGNAAVGSGEDDAGGGGAGRAGGSEGGGGGGGGGGRVTYFWGAQEMDKLVRIVQEEGVGDWERKAFLLGTNRSAGSVEQ